MSIGLNTLIGVGTARAGREKAIGIESSDLFGLSQNE